MLRDVAGNGAHVSPEINKVNGRDNMACDENTSPNGRIKAWRTKNLATTGIPSPPETLAVTPIMERTKDINMASTERENTLKAIKSQIQERLDTERKAQISAVKKLEEIGGDDERCLELKEEVNSRSSKILVLSQKLTRAQHTLGTLQRATDEYQDSAKKVKDAQHKIQHRASVEGLRLSTRESKSLRHELDAATSMMNAACQRVEQIESITDALIKQLSETEAELAELQDVHSSELVRHSAEVEKLAHERDCMALQVAAFESKIKELKSKDDELTQKLSSETSRRQELSKELEKADKARKDANKKLQDEQKKLEKSLADVENKQKELQTELADKEARLREALELARQGTPKGRGAKQVLPMALRKLKDTQEELDAIREERERALKDLEYSRQLAQAREDTLLEQMEMKEADSAYQLKEKQASLESMMRAAAVAAKDAAVKQESINKLTAEISSIRLQKMSLDEELESVQGKYKTLSSELHIANTKSSAAQQQICQLKQEMNVVKAQALEKEIVLKTQVEETRAHAMQLQQQQKSLEEALHNKHAEFESLCTDLRAREDDIAQLERLLADARTRAEEMVHAMEKEKEKSKAALQEMQSAAETNADLLMEANKTIQSLNERLSVAIAARKDLSASLQEKELELSKITSTYEDATKALEKVVSQRDEEVKASKRECEILRSQVDAVSKEICALQAEHESWEQKSAVRIDELTSELENSKKYIECLEEKRAALEAQGREKEDKAFQELAALKSELQAALEKRKEDGLMYEQNKKEFLNQLVQAENNNELLEKQNDKLARIVERLGDELSVKENQIEVARAQGTPKGEASKEILKRALYKVRDMNDRIKALERERDDKEDDLISKEEIISNLLTNIEEMKSQTCQLKMELQQSSEEVRSSKERQAGLHKELTSAIKQLSDEQQKKVALAEQLQCLEESQLTERCQVEAEISSLKASREEAEQMVQSLESQLKQTREVLCALRASENSAQEVLSLTFKKVEDLQKNLKEKSLHVEELESKLQIANLTLSEVKTKLTVVQKDNMEATKAADDKLRALEDNVSRLRIELVEEVHRNKELVSEIAALKMEKHAVEKENASLFAQLAELESRYQIARDDIDQHKASITKVQNESSEAILKINAQLERAVQDKEAAVAESLDALKNIARIEAELKGAKEALSRHKSELSTRNSEMEKQRLVIEDKENLCESLNKKVSKAESEIKQQSDKIRQLSKAKLDIEVKFEAEIKELQDALEKEKAKEDERSLAEIAAERSAKALRETQTRLRDSEEKHKLALKKITTLTQELTAARQWVAMVEGKSAQLQVHIKEQNTSIQELTNTIRQQEETWVSKAETWTSKEEDFQKALAAAQWLTSTLRKEYGRKVQILEEQIRKLDQRTMLMDRLELQNVELCAQLRDLHDSCNEKKSSRHHEVLYSHHMEDVDTVTSPPEKSTRRHASTLAALSVAAVSILGTAALRTQDTPLRNS